MTTILIKKKDTAGAPAPGDLTNAAGGAEIAVNTATKRIYTKDSGGTVVEVGTNPTATTMNGNLTFAPDATYDIGASGATRPRDVFMSRNLTVGGTMTVAGGINFNGNVTVGDSSADTLTINSTITSNLIFTDNTYDIGASGATRPRTLYLGTSLITPAITNSGLTSGRVTYATTGGLLTDSANLLYSGTDLTVYGITVGRGGGAVSNNTAVGNIALTSNTTGSRNTAVGYFSAIYNTTGASNTAVGISSLYTNTTGSSNTAIGDAALTANSTGSNNIAIGGSALNANTTASNNTALGYQSLYSNTGNPNSTAVGYQALYANTAGNNTAVGASAGAANTTGDYIVAFGAQALAANTTGTSNSALGQGSLYQNTTGGYNTAVGRSSLFANTVGGQNTAVGFQALQSNTNAYASTAVGYQALANQSGSNAYANTALGNQAGQAVTTGRGNTLIGQGVGVSLTTGSKNVFLGGGDQATNYPAGYYVTTGSSNTILGNYSGNAGGLDIRTASNYIVLSDGDGNIRMYSDGSGNTVIGISNGAAYFGSKFIVGKNGSDVVGFVNTSGNAGETVLTIKGGVNTTDTTTQYVVFQRSDGTARGSIIATGTTSVVYSTSSDYRLKTVIGPVSDAGARLDALEPIEFLWNEDGSTDRGFLAHKFKEVYLRSVSGEKDEVDENGNPKYQSMQASTAEVIADLVSEIQSLRKRLANAGIA